MEKFLREVLNTEKFPLTVMDRPIESETTKIVENSYRATILAFLNEWSLFAERNGVDLIKVIQAIKMRPTHSNMIFPGPGIGGYCLPKDGGLGYWAYKHILGFEDGDQVFKISPTAVDINDTRALHVAELTRDALRNMGRYIAGADVLLCGASYRQDVGDTRYSGSEMVVRKLTEMGAEMRVHDPYVDHWYELENQDVYPAPGHSWSRFFRNQEGLKDIRVQKDLAAALNDAEAVILAVPHEPYLKLDPDADRPLGRRAAGRDRLLRHPLRRQDPPLLRAGLRGQGPRPRPHPADQGTGPLARKAEPRSSTHSQIGFADSFLGSDTIRDEDGTMQTVLDQHIEIDASIRGGMPHIAGTRIAVSDVVLMHLRLGSIPGADCRALRRLARRPPCCDGRHYDHQAEINRAMQEEDAALQASRESHSRCWRQSSGR